MADVERQCAEARAAGRRYLLVCIDMWDRARGDADLGYYYPAFDHDHEVEAALKTLAAGAIESDDMRDRCEAVVELGTADVIHDPAAWLHRRRRH